MVWNKHTGTNPTRAKKSFSLTCFLFDHKKRIMHKNMNHYKIIQDLLLSWFPCIKINKTILKCGQKNPKQWDMRIKMKFISTKKLHFLFLFYFYDQILPFSSRLSAMRKNPQLMLETNCIGTKFTFWAKKSNKKHSFSVRALLLQTATKYNIDLDLVCK